MRATDETAIVNMSQLVVRPPYNPTFDLNIGTKLLALIASGVALTFYVEITEENSLYDRILTITPNELIYLFAFQEAFGAMLKDIRSGTTGKIGAFVKGLASAVLSIPFFLIPWDTSLEEKTSSRFLLAFSSFFGYLMLNWLAIKQLSDVWAVLTYYKDELMFRVNHFRGANNRNIIEKHHARMNLFSIQKALRFSPLISSDTISEIKKMPSLEEQYQFLLSELLKEDSSKFLYSPLQSTAFYVMKLTLQFILILISLWGATIFTCAADSSLQNTFSIGSIPSLLFALAANGPSSYVLSLTAGVGVANAAHIFLENMFRCRADKLLTRGSKFGATLSAVALFIGIASSAFSGAAMIDLLDGCGKSSLSSMLQVGNKTVADPIAYASMVIFNIFYAPSAVYNLFWDVYLWATRHRTDSPEHRAVMTEDLVNRLIADAVSNPSILPDYFKQSPTHFKRRFFGGVEEVDRSPNESIISYGSFQSSLAEQQP